MSHAENRVDWCVKKTIREKEEGRKHRGLLKITSDITTAENHTSKAQHNLLAIDYFDRGGFSDWSMAAVFYCVYHCFLAIAVKFGYESRNQECTISLVRYLREQKLIELEERFILALENYNEPERQESNVIEKREFYTYGTTVSADKEELKRSIQLCKECLAQTKRIIYSD